MDPLKKKRKRKYLLQLTSLIYQLNEIRDSLDNNGYAAGPFLKKKFEKKLLTLLNILKKHNCYGIRGKVNNLFKSYLTDRSHRVNKSRKNLNMVSHKPLYLDYYFSSI